MTREREWLRRRRPAVRAEAAPDPGLPERRGGAHRLARDRGRGQPDRLREAASGSTRTAADMRHHQGPARPAFGGADPPGRGLCRDAAARSTTQIVSGFDLWFPKDDRQRVLWPSTVSLSHDYFESLQRHAVPLDERALAALSHSAMALDLYAWLAQRLHRIPKPHRQLVPWVALKDQFGQGYGAMCKFRAEVPAGAAPGARRLPGREARGERQGPAAVHVAAAGGEDRHRRPAAAARRILGASLPGRPRTRTRPYRHLDGTRARG